MKLTLKQIVKIIDEHGFTVERFDGEYFCISGIYPDAIEMVSVTTINTVPLIKDYLGY